MKLKSTKARDNAGKLSKKSKINKIKESVLKKTVNGKAKIKKRIDESRVVEIVKRKINKKKKRIYLDTHGSKGTEGLVNDVSKDLDKRERNRSKNNVKEVNEAERKLAEDLFGEIDHSIYKTSAEPIFNKIFAFRENFGDNAEDETLESEEKVDLSEEAGDEKRKPAWVDDDDDTFSFKFNMSKKKEKKINLKKHKQDYLQKVKNNFNQAFGDDPEWAKLPEEGEDPSKISLKQSTGIYLASREELSQASNTPLPKTILEVGFGKDLNGASYSEGSIIDCCEFNPKYEVAFVCGSTKNGLGAATLFQVNGTNNYKVESLKFPRFPISCGRFLADGTRFIVGSSLNRHFYVYDMNTGKQTKIPWNKQEAATNRGYFEVSSCGRWIAFKAKFGQIDIYDGRLISYIDSLKIPGEVNSFAFSQDGSNLYTHGDLGKVHIFDMATRACIHSFYDSGCLSGTAIDISSRGTLACGSSSGIVNIYKKDEFMKSTSPLPVKAMGNLLTSISIVKFNPSGEILATCSNGKDDAIKLIHVPSATYFSNFPRSFHFNRVNSLDFSPGGGFMSVGNNKGAAKLLRLHHYTKF